MSTDEGRRGDYVPRCGKVYGYKLRCRRLAGHKGKHAIRLTPPELRRVLLRGGRHG